MSDPTPSPAPEPTPAPVAKQPEKITFKTALTDVTVGVGFLITGGEAILASTPSGPVNTGLQIALPVLVAVAAALRKLGG